MLTSFLRQTDILISTGVMPSKTFWQCGDDINTKDDITPFDGTVKNNQKTSILIMFSGIFLVSFSNIKPY